MPPFDSHISCSGVNSSVAPNSNICLMEPGNKSYTAGVLVNWTDFNNCHEVITFFHHYIRFLCTHTYRKNDNLTLQERILHQPNLSDCRSALSPDMTSNPKRKLGDVITVSDAIDHLQKVNLQSRRVKAASLPYYPLFQPPLLHGTVRALWFPKNPGGCT
jgi:hypothetical protein